MSIGPVPGNGISINLPKGKVVFWSATAQAAYKQFVQLKDSKGNVIFSAQGNSPDGHTATQFSQGFFQAADPTETYTVWLGTDGGAKWSQVLWSQDAIASGSKIHMGKYAFTTEDAGDKDFNDTYLEMQWFQYLG